MDQKKISPAVIARLPRYYRYLGYLMDEKVERISSAELSSIMNVTSSQFRQDLNHFGGFGQQGYGYNVEYLYNEIGKILGLTKEHTMIIIGAGNLGKAIANYMNFEKRGFKVVGLFDKEDAQEDDLIRGNRVMGIHSLKQFLSETPVDIAALTLPSAGANEVLPILVDGNVKAIWNFAHTDLDVPEGIDVENVHLSESLMKLSYAIHAREEDNRAEEDGSAKN